MSKAQEGKPHTTFRILVVCTGNICRSPMGEIVLRQKLAAAGIMNVIVSSAAVSSEEHGNPIDARAKRVLQVAGYETTGHRAHRVTTAELQAADLVLAMTAGHAHALRRMMHEAGISLAKLHLWREYDGTMSISPNGVFGADGALSATARPQKASRFAELTISDGEYDVPDPWYGTQADFDATLMTIERGAAGVITQITKNSRQ